MKNSFIFYYEYKQHLQLLNDKELGQLVRAIMDYEIDGIEPDIKSGKVQMAYSFVKSNLDRDREKWEATCSKRKESGSKGGVSSGISRTAKQNEANEANASTAKQNEANASQTKQNEANEADNVNVNVNVNVNDNDNVNDIESTVPSGKRTPKIKKYGIYENVKLTDADLEKLKSEFPFEWEERIERLSEYIAAKGDKYKCHIAVIRSWAKKDAAQPNAGTVSKTYAPQYNSNPFLEMLKEEEAKLEQN